MNFKIILLLLGLITSGGSFVIWKKNSDIEDLESRLEQVLAEKVICQVNQETLKTEIDAQNNALQALRQTNLTLQGRARDATVAAHKQLKAWQDKVNQGSGHEDLNEWFDTLLQQ